MIAAPRLFLIVAALVSAGSSPAVSQSGEGSFYRVNALPDSPNGDEVNSRVDFNAHGDVLGDEMIDGGTRPYLWLSASHEFVSITAPPDCSVADLWERRMNDNHVVVGLLVCSGSLDSWRWTSDSGAVLVSELPNGPGTSCVVTAVNNRGAIAGVGVSDPSNSRLFLWDPDAGTLDIPTGTSNPYEVADLNDNDWLVANESFGDATGTYLWTPQSGYGPFADFPYESINFVNYSNAINASGHIVGGATWWCGYAYDLCIFPFIWTPVDGVELLLDAAPVDAEHVWAEAIDINAHDVVIGTTGWTGQPGRPTFIWDRTHGFRLLRDRFDPCAARPIGVRTVHAINDAGQILASRQVDQSALVLTPYLRGDLDENRVVELVDLGRLLTHFGRTGGMHYAEGDLDCDADVDLQDLAILLSNFGETLP